MSTNESRKSQSQKHYFVGSNWVCLQVLSQCMLVCQSFRYTLVCQLNLGDYLIRKVYHKFIVHSNNEISHKKQFLISFIILV